MIYIKKPYIERTENKARCCCDVVVDLETRNIWFEVDLTYEKYLTPDRADAYVIGLLHWAMQNNHNIKCEVPMTDELLYNLQTILIPSLSKSVKEFYPISIEAATASPLPGEAVGTGCSCGVDSLDAIYMHYNTDFKNMDLTHLCINNVGAFNECYAGYGPEKVKEERYAAVDAVSEELGLPVIKTDSNFAEAFPQTHLYTATYSSVFAIYMLQRLWKTYYYASSGLDYSFFSLSDKECAHYDLLSLQCFSTSGLKIYSEGGEKTRLEKVMNIAHFETAQKHLHVCLTKPYNCGVCSKCRRTLVMLDTLGCLDNFGDVFDIEYYRKHKREYYRWLYELHVRRDKMTTPVYNDFCKRADFKMTCCLYAPVFLAKRILHKIKVLIKGSSR